MIHISLFKQQSVPSPRFSNDDSSDTTSVPLPPTRGRTGLLSFLPQLPTRANVENNTAPSRTIQTPPLYQPTPTPYRSTGLILVYPGYIFRLTGSVPNLDLEELGRGIWMWCQRDFETICCSIY